ncbi:cytochrome-c peroxidase [Leptospira ilyithenensis]|uniref:Methylamine utilization protein MauG n=1 Tax=Leptospira ilyithenensis TaxID=2484901 RepID=A0A4V3JWY7_9LEPT|nr:tryptophan tryptophylquinone biosynthesis enzyme MauG [Leptospira ilyithenensis]
MDKIQFLSVIILSFFLIECKGFKPTQDNLITPSEVVDPATNPTTPDKIALGKMLFFDPRLSGSNWISCATCHNPSLGWSDGLSKGLGHGMLKLGRNSPTIINASFGALQFWDGRAPSLEEQAKGPIQSPGEMNQNPEELVQELKKIPAYVDLFHKTFPKEGLTFDNIANAIASFERTIVSKNSPFDKWRSGDATAVSDSAKRGFDLFNSKAKCILCHQGFNFSDNGFHNIGLKEEEGVIDVGRFEHLPIKVLKGAFKTPTLRDITLSGPYMHNGMYNNLEEIVEHYDRGGDNKENLSPNISPLGLSEEEKKDLVAFMKTLTGDPITVLVPRLPQ